MGCSVYITSPHNPVTPLILTTEKLRLSKIIYLSQTWYLKAPNSIISPLLIQNLIQGEDFRALVRDFQGYRIHFIYPSTSLLGITGLWKPVF